MTKIDIFSGFLGAGKTTLIKKLITEAFAGQQVVLIENEFGEIGIDGGFLKESGIQINELNAGCICCSLVGDFRTALQQVVEQYHPDRIVIEPSGVGKLSDVTRAVEGVAEHLDVQLNSFVTVADVNKVKMYMKNFGEFYDDQISHASCILLSRTQTASEEKIAAAVAMLREKNPTATIVTTAWDELTCEHNIHQNTYCVNVSPFIGLIYSVLFGCGISHCTNSLCVFRLIGLVQPCRIKINQLYISAAVNHHIFRLNILVYNLVRM